MVFDWPRQYKDTSSGSPVMEWVDFPLEEKQIKELKEMLSSNTLRLRLTGKYSRDIDIVPEHVKFLREMIVFFESL